MIAQYEAQRRGAWDLGQYFAPRTLTGYSTIAGATYID